MNSPEDEAPLPSEPILSEEETARQIHDDFAKPFKSKIKELEQQVACWTFNCRTADQARIKAERERDVLAATLKDLLNGMVPGEPWIGKIRVDLQETISDNKISGLPTADEDSRKKAGKGQ